MFGKKEKHIWAKWEEIHREQVSSALGGIYIKVQILRTCNSCGLKESKYITPSF